MTAAEKAGQLSQYFYFGSQQGTDAASSDLGQPPASPLLLRRRLSTGRLGRFCSSTTQRRSIACNGSPLKATEKQRQRYRDEESTPLFPFGHGLSYSRFEYSRLILDRGAITPGESLIVSADVFNAGGREADEVVQLYIHQRHGSASRPVRELKGFQRVSLAAGERRTVQFTLGPAELRYWSAAARDWVIDASAFDVWIGGDSTAELSTAFDVSRP